MIKKAAIFISIFLAAAVQFSFFPAFLPAGTGPDLLLLLVIFWALQDGFEKTVARAAFAGFIADLFYFHPVGTNMLLFSLAAFGVSSLAKRFMVSHKAWDFFFTSGVVALGTVIYTVFLNIAGNTFDLAEGQGRIISLWRGLDWTITLKIVFNLAAFALVSRPLERIEKTFEFYSQRMPGFKK